MKLADLDPVTVAREATRRLVDHLHHVAFVALLPGVTLRLEPSEALHEDRLAAGTDLGLSVQTLTVYAQRGLPVWDWSDHGCASDALVSVLSALYSSAADASLQHTEIDRVDDADPTDAIGLVLVAAAARVRLSQGVELTARELGALAGIGAGRVRQLIASGELATTQDRPARVGPEDARRWLTARGVQGV